MTRAKHIEEYIILDRFTLRLTDCPRGGATWALIASDAPLTAHRKRICSGHIARGMATGLRRVAGQLDDWEDKLPRGDV